MQLFNSAGCSVLSVAFLLSVVLINANHDQDLNVPTDATLFAVIGERECANDLRYGTYAITTEGSTDGDEFYLSIKDKDEQHDSWLQIVTSDGSELFRTYWTFTVTKTLQERFVDAVNFGEEVNYEVVEENSGESRFFDATWRFSSVSEISDEIFTGFGSSSSSRCCFSRAHGAWGAASGSVDGADRNVPDDFWGQGNFDYSNRNRNDDDEERRCERIYMDGRVESDKDTKSFFYYLNSNVPTVVPTKAPTFNFDNLLLLGVIGGGDSCAGDIAYGVGDADSVDASQRSFLSLANDYEHSEWVQDVFLSSTGDFQFRIIWQFAEKKSLVQRLEDAVAVGEEVDFIVLDSVSPVTVLATLSGNWRLSSNAFEPGTLQAAISAGTSSTCCLSADGAAWGAGSGEIDGSGTAPSDFWGIGSFSGSATTDPCSGVYRDGDLIDESTAATATAAKVSSLRRALQSSGSASTLYLSDADVPDDDGDDDDDDNSSSSSSDLQLVVIITIVVVAVVLITCIALFLRYCVARRKQQSQAVQADAHFSTPADYATALTTIAVQPPAVAAGYNNNSGGADNGDSGLSKNTTPSAPPVRIESMDSVELEALTRSGAVVVASPVDTRYDYPAATASAAVAVADNSSPSAVRVVVASPYR